MRNRMIRPYGLDDSYSYPVWGTGRCRKYKGELIRIEDINRNEIYAIKFLNQIPDDLPDDAWDISEDSDGSVMAWTIENDWDMVHEASPTLFGNKKLYIAANGYIIANENCNHMFADFNFVKYIDAKNLHTDYTTNMSHMFAYCYNLETMDISNFNTENVENMSYMFGNCLRLRDIDVTHFNTSRVSNMEAMFLNCALLKEIIVSNFNTENVKYMKDMFCGCRSLTKLDLTSFSTNRTINMSSMFEGCCALQKIDALFNIKNVKDMRSIFKGCYELMKNNSGKYTTENTVDMREMFTGKNL